MKYRGMVKANSFKIKTCGSEATSLEAYSITGDENIFLSMIDFYGDERRLTANPKEMLDFILKIVQTSCVS